MTEKMQKAKRKVSDVMDSREMEIVEFCVGGKYYGVDVVQVREIIRAGSGVIPVSDAHPSISGVINLRGKIIPVVNLAQHFGMRVAYDVKQSRIIVSTFNENYVGFWVHNVTRIHRVDRSDVEPPAHLTQSKGRYFTGVIKIEDRVLFLVDFEKIAMDINSGMTHLDEGSVQASLPQTNLPAGQAGVHRAAKRIMVVGDSSFIRESLVRHIREAGYHTLLVGNGLDAWQILEDTARSPEFGSVGRHYNLLITDIEMPQINGLHLVQNIRNHPLLKELPCVICAPLLTEELIKRCQNAGVDAPIGQNEMEMLVPLIDDKVLK
jgi:two-component system chemotaxis response regulator CheV